MGDGPSNFDSGLPADLEAWLASRCTPVSREQLAATRDATLATLHSVGVVPDSELAEFYADFGPSCVAGCHELNELAELEMWTRFVREELEVPANYVALTGIDGEGIVLYDCHDGSVHDVELSDFDELEEGLHQALASSFADYLRWCRSRSRA